MLFVSGVEENLAKLPDGYFVIGDAAYHTRTYLVPVLKDVGDDPARIQFNFVMSSLRMAVERAFGAFKGRFARFCVPSLPDSVHFRRMLAAAVVVHNFIVSRRGDAGLAVPEFPALQDVIDVPPDDAAVDDDEVHRLRGVAFRDALMREVLDYGRRDRD